MWLLEYWVAFWTPMIHLFTILISFIEILKGGDDKQYGLVILFTVLQFYYY